MAFKFGKLTINKPLDITHIQLGFPYNKPWFNISNFGVNTGWNDHKENAKLECMLYKCS